MIRAIWLLLAAVFPGTAFGQIGDVAAGEQFFRRCQACHMIGPAADNRVGPPLNGIVDAPWGAAPGYSYSVALMAGAAEGRIWDVATLGAYLHNPRHTLPGTTMTFFGIQEKTDLANLIAYLATFAADGSRR